MLRYLNPTKINSSNEKSIVKIKSILRQRVHYTFLNYLDRSKLHKRIIIQRMEEIFINIISKIVL